MKAIDSHLIRSFTCGSLMLLALTGSASADGVLEVIPVTPGPYEAGQTVAVEVWLHNGEPQDIYLRYVSLDIRGLRETLFVAGDFKDAGGFAVERVAQLDGNEWRPLPGASTPGTVQAIAGFPDKSSHRIIMGTGEPRANLITWNGFSSETFYQGPAVSRMLNLFSMDDGSGETLFASGIFLNYSESPSDLVKWNGQSWDSFPPFSAGVRCAAMFDDGEGDAMYAGGWFIWAYNGTSLARCKHVAKLNNGVWESLGDGVRSGFQGTSVNALAVFDEGQGDRLFVGGDFYYAYNSTSDLLIAQKIARWDGSTWSPVGGGLNPDVPGMVNDMVVFDDGSGPALFVGGRFTMAGTTPVKNVARWDGNSWSDVGGGVTGSDAGIEKFLISSDECGPVLLACGKFDVAGSVSASGVAKWNGVTWVPVGNGLDDTSYSMAFAHSADSTEPGVEFGGPFQFDFSTLPLGGVLYFIDSSLPRPTIAYTLTQGVTDGFLRLPGNGSLRMGTMNVEMPDYRGTFSLDVVSAGSGYGSQLLYGFGGTGDPIIEVSAQNGGLTGDHFSFGQIEPACMCEGSACGDQTETTCNHADTCDGLGGCLANWATNGTSCSDGNACTTSDECSGGFCAGGPPPNCNDGIACTIDTCHSSIGCLHTPNPGSCGTPPQCKYYYCDPVTGCQLMNLPNNSCCDDGKSSTQCDKCTNGVCSGSKNPGCIPCDNGCPEC